MHCDVLGVFCADHGNRDGGREAGGSDELIDCSTQPRMDDSILLHLPLSESRGCMFNNVSHKDSLNQLLSN